MNELQPDLREMMAFRLAQEIRDGEIGSPGGASSEVPMAAIRLAQMTHAPNASFITSASGYVCNLSGKSVPPLLSSSTDFRNSNSGAEALFDWTFVLSTHRDFFFLGGLQVDLHGNLNLIGVGDYPNLKMRGPGSAGIAQGSALAARFYIYLAEHSARTLVPVVQYVSAVGHPRPGGIREDLRLPGGGPRLVVTPFGVLGFGDDQRLQLQEVMPGVTIDQVWNATPEPFRPNSPDSLRYSSLPSKEELQMFRSVIDRNGLLRKER